MQETSNLKNIKNLKVNVDALTRLGLITDPFTPTTKSGEGRQDKSVTFTSPTVQTRRISSIVLGRNKKGLLLEDGTYIRTEDIFEATEKCLNESGTEQRVIVSHKTGKVISKEELIEEIKDAIDASVKKSGKVTIGNQGMVNHTKAADMTAYGANNGPSQKGKVFIAREIQIPNGDYVRIEDINIALSEYMTAEEKKLPIPIPEVKTALKPEGTVRPAIIEPAKPIVVKTFTKDFKPVESEEKKPEQPVVVRTFTKDFQPLEPVFNGVIRWAAGYTEEQILDAISRGIDKPDGIEYEQWLNEVVPLGDKSKPGIIYTGKSFMPSNIDDKLVIRWAAGYTEEQILDAISRGIDRPDGIEYEQWLNEVVPLGNKSKPGILYTGKPFKPSKLRDDYEVDTTKKPVPKKDVIPVNREPKKEEKQVQKEEPKKEEPKKVIPSAKKEPVKQVKQPKKIMARKSNKPKVRIAPLLAAVAIATSAFLGSIFHKPTKVETIERPAYTMVQEHTYDFDINKILDGELENIDIYNYIQAHNYNIDSTRVELLNENDRYSLHAGGGATKDFHAFRREGKDLGSYAMTGFAIKTPDGQVYYLEDLEGDNTFKSNIPGASHDLTEFIDQVLARRTDLTKADLDVYVHFGASKTRDRLGWINMKDLARGGSVQVIKDQTRAPRYRGTSKDGFARLRKGSEVVMVKLTDESGNLIAPGTVVKGSDGEDYTIQELSRETTQTSVPTGENVTEEQRVFDSARYKFNIIASGIGVLSSILLAAGVELEAIKKKEEAEKETRDIDFKTREEYERYVEAFQEEKLRYDNHGRIYNYLIRRIGEISELDKNQIEEIYIILAAKYGEGKKYLFKEEGVFIETPSGEKIPVDEETQAKIRDVGYENEPKAYTR